MAREVSSEEDGIKKEKWKFSSIFSSSCGATVFMALYVSTAIFNLYGLMYPLTKINLNDFQPNSFIHPLWDTEAKMGIKVYLSMKPLFYPEFVKSEFEPTAEEEEIPKETILLWQQPLDKASLSKTFLISSLDCIGEENDDGSACDKEGGVNVDPSLKFAREWLDTQDKASMEDDGSIFSTIQSAAGQGIESTSILLTIGQGISNKFNSLFQTLGLVEDKTNDDDTASRKAILERTNVHLPVSSPIWSHLMNNSPLYVHVLLVREQFYLDGPDVTLKEASKALAQANTLHSLLVGKVSLVKYDTPSHLGRPDRILLWDLAFLFRKYILQDRELGRPPWEMETTKPEYFKAYQQIQQMKIEGRKYPYWKPEVAVKYLIDEDSYPSDYAGISGMEFVRVKRTQEHPTGYAHIPALYVDEIGLTSDKYIPLNQTVTSLPLRISFDRSDMQDEQHRQGATATAGGISPARWRLLNHLSKSLESQRELGFEQSDIDDMRRLIADTNVTLLAITVLASALHMLFEFLTFKNEVHFWNNNSDLTGLSVRSLFLDLFGQVIIILYLIEQETSFLMTITAAFGVLVAFWKCHRAAGFAFVPLSEEEKGQKSSIINFLPRLFGYQFKAQRLSSKAGSKDEKGSGSKGKTKSSASDLETLTLEADRQATVWLGSALLPMVFGYTIYSLVQQEHASWYSWFITSASSGVYAFGFVLMTPQLFLNYKMKSVAHLPWRVLVYKSLNTFIDDLFAFIIRMPTMARMSCFRDDIVFFIYLYQRWLYPVDASRPVEGGGEGESAAETNVSDAKKNQ